MPCPYEVAAGPKSFVAIALLLSRSQAASKQVDDQRQDRGVVGKREELMAEHHPAHPAVRDVDVGDLEGHANAESKIGEIGIVRRSTAELESAIHVGFSVIQAGIVKCIGRVEQG